MGIDWMQRLRIHLNADNSNLQIHNMELIDTGRKIAQLKNELIDLFYNKEIKVPSGKINLKEGSQRIQRKGQPIPINLP